MTDAVLIERRDGVLVITINRPEAKNAVNGAVAAGIAAALDELDADDDLRVGRADRRRRCLLGRHGPQGLPLRRGARSIEGRGLGGLTEAPPRKPLIAAVEGWALAGGFELMLACDLVVAAETARFGVPEVKRALVAGAGAAVLLPQRIPRTIALELLLTGEPIDAAAGRRRSAWSTASLPRAARSTAPSSWPRRSRRTARWRSRSPSRSRVEARDWDFAEGWQKQSELMMPVFGSEDAQEGATAFAEKRPPVWKGR